MIKVVFVAILVNTGIIINVDGVPTDDYLWRDYDGKLPSDALQGGIDPYGKPIYIGQVLFEHKLIPGKIYEHDPNIYFAWGAELKKTENVKILCTPYPNRFEWVPTRHDEITRLVEKMLFRGGFEAGYTTYIGRKQVAGETTIGRVMCYTSNLNCLGLYATKAGKQDIHTGDLEILTYVPEKSLISNEWECQTNKIWPRIDQFSNE